MSFPEVPPTVMYLTHGFRGPIAEYQIRYTRRTDTTLPQLAAAVYQVVWQLALDPVVTPEAIVVRFNTSMAPAEARKAILTSLLDYLHREGLLPLDTLEWQIDPDTWLTWEAPVEAQQ